MRKITLTTKDGETVTTTLANSVAEAIRITGTKQVVLSKVEPLEPVNVCEARRNCTREMVCSRCALRWDVDDVLPPECPNA